MLLYCSSKCFVVCAWQPQTLAVLYLVLAMDCCSSKREPLGKGYVRGHQIPEGLGAADPFGVAVHAKVRTAWHAQFHGLPLLSGVLLSCPHHTLTPNTTCTHTSLNSSHALHGWQSKLVHLFTFTIVHTKTTCLVSSIALHLCPCGHTVRSIAETAIFLCANEQQVSTASSFIHLSI